MRNSKLASQWSVVGEILKIKVVNIKLFHFFWIQHSRKPRKTFQQWRIIMDMLQSEAVSPTLPVETGSD